MAKAIKATPTNLQRERISAPFSQERSRRVRSHLTPGKGALWASSGLRIKSMSAEHSHLPVQQRERPDPVQAAYPAGPVVSLDCNDKWRNDMGLFLGRSFRVCFSASGKVYMPAQCFGKDTVSRVGGAHQVLVKPMAGRLFEHRPGGSSGVWGGNGYAPLLQAHLEMSQMLQGGGGEETVMQGLERYCSAASGMEGVGGKRAASVLTCVRALQESTSESLLTSFSAWLERDLKETVEQALAIEADSGTALSSYDKIFSHLTGKQIDAACAVAQTECKDFALAVLLSQAGEDTALPEDMRAQVLWLESQYAHERIDDESAKLLQIYRLLAGEVDEVLCHISEDFKSDAGARQGSRRVVGGQLLDWRRCLALFLWYASPAHNQETVNQMCVDFRAQASDLFADNRALHLSLQGAIQYYLSKCWVGRGPSRDDTQVVPHPWPAYVEEPGTPSGVPHLLRQVLHAGPNKACPRMTPAVQTGLGWVKSDKPRMPASGVLRAPAGRGDVDEFWEGCAVDIRLELASLLFPTGTGADASMSRVLETETNSPLGLDTELSWHVHEVLVRLAHIGETGSGILAQRLRRRLNEVGQLLSLHQRALLTHQFAAQLEMAGAWQAAAYVLVSFAPLAAAASAMDQSRGGCADADADAARLQAALALRALLSRHATALERKEPVVHVAHVCTLTVDNISERLQLTRDEVLSWFLQAQAWALRGQIPASTASVSSRTRTRRLRIDAELDVCVRAGEWLRANHLLLSIITPLDLPDPSMPNATVPQHTVELLRTLDAGLAAWRCSYDWNPHRSLDLWSQGSSAILALLEVLEVLESLQFVIDARLNELPGLMAKTKEAGKVLGCLPPRTQRAVDHLYTKVAVSLWQCTQVPGELGIECAGGGQEASHLVTLNELPVAPSKQLYLLQKLAMARLAQGKVESVVSGSWDDQNDQDWLDDRDTEMC